MEQVFACTLVHMKDIETRNMNAMGLVTLCYQTAMNMKANMQMARDMAGGNTCFSVNRQGNKLIYTTA